MRVLVLGGTGTISTALLASLQAMGHLVTALNRGRTAACPAGIEALRADRHDRASLTEALAGRRFDVTIDMLCFDAAQAGWLVEALPDHGHLVLCSSVCALGIGDGKRPQDEETTPAPHFDYGQGKAAAEAALQAYAQRTGCPLTVVRPSTTFDHRIGLLRQLRYDGSAWLARIGAGRPIAVSDEGQTLHQFLHAEDAGRAFALVAGNPAAFGRTYHLVGPATSWAAHHRLAMDAMGRRVPLVGVPREILERNTVPDNGIFRLIFRHPGVFADTRLQREIGFVPQISLATAIERTVEGLARAGRLVRTGDETWEDDLIAQHGTELT